MYRDTSSVDWINSCDCVWYGLGIYGSCYCSHKTTIIILTKLKKDD